MKFIIDRSKWRCGDVAEDALGKGDTVLLNDEGFMCCLGQIALQIGYEKSDIKNIGCPATVNKLRKKDNILTIYIGNTEQAFDSYLSAHAMQINDNRLITQKEREEQLIELFREEGHRIKFINKGVKFKS